MKGPRRVVFQKGCAGAGTRAKGGLDGSPILQGYQDVVGAVVWCARSGVDGGLVGRIVCGEAAYPVDRIVDLGRSDVAIEPLAGRAANAADSVRFKPFWRANIGGIAQFW